MLLNGYIISGLSSAPEPQEALQLIHARGQLELGTKSKESLPLFGNPGLLQGIL